MAKRAPGRPTASTGRTTPKGGLTKGSSAKGGLTKGSPAKEALAKGKPSAGKSNKEKVAPSSGRYTPPIPRSQKVSPRWVPALMFLFLLSGAAVILLNYLSLLPGDADNRYLLVGLGLITGGFITATRYH